jgi:hypothetical protein
MNKKRIKEIIGKNYKNLIGYYSFGNMMWR